MSDTRIHTVLGLCGVARRSYTGPRKKHSSALSMRLVVDIDAGWLFTIGELDIGSTQIRIYPGWNTPSTTGYFRVPWSSYSDMSYQLDSRSLLNKMAPNVIYRNVGVMLKRIR